MRECAGANRWVQQKAFVYPLYGPHCTDDLAARAMEYSGNYKAFVRSNNVSSMLNGYYFVKELHYGTYTVQMDTETCLDA